ncbi:MAG: DUF2798 domain-containing protein [Pseudomonas fluorescens]|nr:MAG: DUF2798 domain-containing protein [Pseudomonas fluorescens]
MPAKLPAQYYPIILPLMVSFAMSGIVTFVATLRNLGLHDGILKAWLDAWPAGWIVAFPTLLVVLPFMKRIVGLFVTEPTPKPKT